MHPNLLKFFLYISVFGQSVLATDSRENDPESLVENVSVIHGDYTEVEVDLSVSAPDTLLLTRFYSSRDTTDQAQFGGWRLSPHCYLSVHKETEKTGGFSHINIGNSDGSTLTYVLWKENAFKLAPEGYANTAKGTISAWTNPKNNELYFFPEADRFELKLSSEGMRFYSKHSPSNTYVLTHEILPSGNQIYYEFDANGRLIHIKETNRSGQKTLAWIKIVYGNQVHVETSDGKKVDYHFVTDSSGCPILHEVIRSHKPHLLYEYQIVDGHVLLIKKNLPEGRTVEIEYVSNQVRSIKAPESDPTLFTYGEGWTEVIGAGHRKTVYRFDVAKRLNWIEQYLEGNPYRVHRKTWEACNLIETSIEDAKGIVYHKKQFIYDEIGNIVEERETREETGLQESVDCESKNMYIKYYSHFSFPDTRGYLQTDLHGNGIKYWYKAGTNLLLKKFILTKGSADREEEDIQSGIRERHFYRYNEDSVLTEVIIDDGGEGDLNDTYRVTARKITRIVPKDTMPALGSAEIVEQKYSPDGSSEFLLQKTVNQFDPQGNLAKQTVYGADGRGSYSTTKQHSNGLLISATDPMGNRSHYSYDANHNLILETHSNSSLTCEYEYDAQNRLICTVETDQSGNQFKSSIAYDSAGNIRLETDRTGYETTYVYDSLGRALTITHPSQATYTYTYDLFDHPTSVTDPKGRTLIHSYNMYGKPLQIDYLDGSKELFNYDTAGNLYHYLGRDGLLQSFSYDYKGRLANHATFMRGSVNAKHPLKQKAYTYGVFEKKTEIDEKGEPTCYYYDDLGRLASMTKEERTSEFTYDNFNRVHGIKKWRTENVFYIDYKEYDLANRIVEERTEDSKEVVISKTKYVYNKEGRLKELIGYPENQETVLFQYEYDGFGRPIKETNALGHATTIQYDPHFINQRGEKSERKIVVDPKGNRAEEIFDSKGQLIQILSKNQAGQTLTAAEYTYDESGNLIAERHPIYPHQNVCNAYETKSSLNAKEQVASYTFGKGTVDESTVKFVYSPYGEIALKTNDLSNKPIEYRYSHEGNLDLITYTEGGAEIEYALIYDQRNHLTEVFFNSAPLVTRMYDAHDQLISETLEDEFGSYEVFCTYNRDGNIQTLLLPDRSYVQYAYQGPYVKKITRFSRDHQELYKQIIVSRDWMGNILEEALPMDLGTRKQNWDKTGRRVKIATRYYQDSILDIDILENILKRNTGLGVNNTTTNYAYDDLSQLIFEKGRVGHKYSYDSIGNRLEKDDIPYAINGLNQLTKTAGTTYTYDENGTLSKKIIEGKTWIYRRNALGQIVVIEDPDQNVLRFTYDPSGRRLTKSFGKRGQKPKITRFFYLGNTEIGALNEQGAIVELKIPSNPNNPESPSIALELRNQIYIPLYDLEGNIACLLDPQKKGVVESYHYSAFGEEEILSEKGTPKSTSSFNNPWRYRGKRVDAETGLVCFGFRYYDPVIGRWISQDPLGSIDGPNLYAYVHNQPMKYVDRFGLFAILDPDCGCTKHNHPGFHNAPVGCICICGKDEHPPYKVGSDLWSAISGTTHGVVDYVLCTIHDVQTMATYIGSDELNLSVKERTEIINQIEASQARQVERVGDALMSVMSVNPSDSVHQAFRSGTTMGLEIGSIIAGGYGAIKGVIGFTRLARAPVQAVNAINTFSHTPINPLRGTRYTRKVLSQMENSLITGRPDYHGFPRIVDNYAGLGKSESILGRDAFSRVKISLPGSYSGQEGSFEWIIENDLSINHRLFVPNPRK